MKKFYKLHDAPAPDVCRRIEALVDIPEYGVKAGDLGGLVQSERNLAQDGSWLPFGVVVTGWGRVFGRGLLMGTEESIYPPTAAVSSGWIFAGGTGATPPNFMQVEDPAPAVIAFAEALVTQRMSDDALMWWLSLYSKYVTHPCVIDMLKLHGVPDDMAQIVMEQPHVSTEDTFALAYTQNAEKGERNLQTRTKIGRYLKRHWSKVRDDQIRSVVEAYEAKEDPTGKFAMLETSDEFVKVVTTGPYSCMKTEFDDDVHPYRAYDPEFGWRMAVRRETKDPDSQVLGRALVYQGPKVGVPVYVRSYAWAGEHSGGGTDTKLEAWLESQGVTPAHAWPYGAQLRRCAAHDRHTEFEVPYLDGSRRYITDPDDETYEVTNQREAYGEADCSAGGWSEPGWTCPCCNERVDEDNTTYIDCRSERVCDDCAAEYTLAIVERGGEEYVNERDTCVYEYNGSYYTREGLEAYDLDVDDDGDVFSLEDMTQAHDRHGGYTWVNDEELDERTVEIDGEYYMRDTPQAIAHLEELEAKDQPFPPEVVAA